MCYLSVGQEAAADDETKEVVVNETEREGENAHEEGHEQKQDTSVPFKFLLEH